MSTPVTGAATAVEFEVAATPGQLWELVTDVPRYGRCSPECEYTAWLDGAGDPPRAGDRFAGRNRFGDTFVTEVVCELTEVTAPGAFAYAVLDDDGAQASLWRYTLGDGHRPGWTRLRHTFEHGPGATYLRVHAPASPSLVDERLHALRDNMAVSLSAMLDGVEHREVAP